GDQNKAGGTCLLVSLNDHHHQSRPGSPGAGPDLRLGTPLRPQRRSSSEFAQSAGSCVWITVAVEANSVRSLTPSRMVNRTADGRSPAPLPVPFPSPSAPPSGRMMAYGAGRSATRWGDV